MDLSEQFRLEDVDVNHPAMQVTMPLISEHDGELRCIGTGFAVAPGLAITASHVVDDWLTHQEDRDGYKNAKSTFSAAALQCFGGNFKRWDVDSIYGSISADIAFIRFRRPDWWGNGSGQVNPVYARLNFNPPLLGDELRVIGFPNSEVKDGVLHISPSESIVRVRRVDLKTDISIRPLSYFEVDGVILGGMSGGPCFDKNWNVIGVNSKGWDGLPLAYVALLWPAMKVEIDLFNAGSFPAIKLFKNGPARALGYRRVHVSKGKAYIAKVDPDGLVPVYSTLYTQKQDMEGALNFAVSSAKEALGEIQVLLYKTLDKGEPLDSNRLCRAIGHYFGELESAITIALRLVVLKADLVMNSLVVNWDEFVNQLRKQIATAEVLDALELLNFSWYGVDLFEIRTYAELYRGGLLRLDCVIGANKQIKAAFLKQCRKGGMKVLLPSGLDRFYDSAKRFVQELLRFTNNIDMISQHSS